jgi:hypothetical protein
MAGRADTDLLEDLLAREQRLLSAYEAALRRDAIDADLGAALRDHEREHVRAVGQLLASAARRNPVAGVPPPELTAALRSRTLFARYAIDLEQQTVAAYAEAAASIGSRRLRRPLGSILACGAAHVVALRDALGERSLVD